MPPPTAPGSASMSAPAVTADGNGRADQSGAVDSVVSAPPPQKLHSKPPADGEPHGRVSGRKDHFLNTGKLGSCSSLGTFPRVNRGQVASSRRPLKASASPAKRHHEPLHGDARDWAKNFFSHMDSRFPVMNPHAKVIQKWNKFFVISCMAAIFIDPSFFFIFSVDEKHKCIVFSWSSAVAIAALRSMTDFIYLLHMLLKFRLAYVDPESRSVGAWDVVVQTKKIALHYLRGFFILDLFVVLPLPQVMILVVIPKYLGPAAANYAKNILRATVLLQHIPKMFTFLPLLAAHSTCFLFVEGAAQSASGFIFESAWANFLINILMFLLAGHIVGSCWYLFGLQRVNQCLTDTCSESGLVNCKRFIDCGRVLNIAKFNSTVIWKEWLSHSNSTDCLSEDSSFKYGIYQQAAFITKQHSIVVRYIYSLFWGFQQISTLAGNLVPSEFVPEVLFTMVIIGLGLLLFALLIGNVQNFLQALGRRTLDMQLRCRDVEQWMHLYRFPRNLRRQIRQAERSNWAATYGVNGDELLDSLPENLQREIRRHWFTFLNKILIFTLMDEPLLDAIRRRLKHKLYIGGSYIQCDGDPIEKMVFILRGKMLSIGVDGHAASLSEGDACGEELIIWFLEYSSCNKGGGKVQCPRQQLFSNRTIKCVTNVEAFTLHVVDMENITSRFTRFLRNPRVQGIIRYQSPFWRTLAATQIQVSWRYRKRCLLRTTDISLGMSAVTSDEKSEGSSRGYQ